MKEFTVSSFMISIVMLGLVMGIFAIFVADLSTNYPVTHEEDDLETYNSLAEMQQTAQEMEEGSNIEEKTGVLDIIGSYFTDAYNVLKMMKQSFNVYDSMSNEAMQDADLGASGRLFKVAFGTVLLILVVVGIISAVVKYRI